MWGRDNLLSICWSYYMRANGLERWVVSLNEKKKFTDEIEERTLKQTSQRERKREKYWCLEQMWWKSKYVNYSVPWYIIVLLQSHTSYNHILLYGTVLKGYCHSYCFVPFFRDCSKLYRSIAKGNKKWKLSV